MDNVPLARHAERYRACAIGEQHVARAEYVVTDPQAIGRLKAGATGKDVDAGVTQCLLALFRNRVGKTALEAHQRRPIDAKRAGNAVWRHTPVPVDQVGGANKYFLGIATAQGAGAAEGKGVDDSDPPAG